MKVVACIALVAVLPLSVLAKEKPRPKILEITQVRIRTTNEKEAKNFYYGALRALFPSASSTEPCDWCERMPAVAQELIEFDSIKGPTPKDLMGAVFLRTDDVEALRNLLRRNKIKVGKLTKWTYGESFAVSDPERHCLVFVQAERGLQPPLGYLGSYGSWPRPGPHIIHAGFVVKDRTAMDHFYKDILGFHLYWHGGMKDGETDWVDMQVPDGTDWIEYMLNVPENADQHLRGVMNHIAVGVSDIKVADQELLASNLHLPVIEAPEIGRDGKWQLNLYDPDGTRIELMEFTPVEKPCCSEYTGPHPKP
jgi:catechol 2,3-dioxygenase-like lactoylglutathione lyase family enzyme